MKQSLIAAAAAVLLAFSAQLASGLTNQDQLEILSVFRDTMFTRPGGNWSKALRTWTCPTDPANSDQSCDPCAGSDKSWGNWEHVGCRLGTGQVSNIHITDNNVEGIVPLAELCALSDLREFDIDGGKMVGPIPEGFSECYAQLKEIDLSYNQLTGSVPASLAAVQTLEQFKIEVNQVSGVLPPELGSMFNMRWLRFAKNKMSGRIPEEMAGTATHLSQLTLDNNDFAGNLYPLSQHSMISFSAQNNPKLCGMVPVGLRFGHGFNYHNTQLGLPCADEIDNGLDVA